MESGGWRRGVHWRYGSETRRRSRKCLCARYQRLYVGAFYDRDRGGEALTMTVQPSRPSWRTMMSWRSPLRRWALLSGAVLWLTGFGVLAQEQSFFTGGPATLTEEQANRGKAVYDENCGSCHGANLDNGQFGPQLRGSAFKMHWASQSANALFTYIAGKMPPAAPASLSDRAYSDVEAYLLRANGVAAGSSELAPARTQSD